MFLVDSSCFWWTRLIFDGFRLPAAGRRGLLGYDTGSGDVRLRGGVQDGSAAMLTHRAMLCAICKHTECNNVEMSRIAIKVCLHFCRAMLDNLILGLWRPVSKERHSAPERILHVFKNQPSRRQELRKPAEPTMGMSDAQAEKQRGP